MALRESMKVLNAVFKDKYSSSDRPREEQDIRDAKSSIEYEIRFGIIKPFTKMEFERIYAKLLSHGFVKESEVHQLKIITDTNIRCEINDLSKIKEYCNTNILPIGCQYITKRSLNGAQKFINENYNFRISIQNEYSYNEKDQEIIDLYTNWQKMTKSFRYMNRIKLVHPYKPGICVDLSIVKSSKRRGDLLKEHDFSKSKLFTEPEIYEIEIEINNPKYARKYLITAESKQYTSIEDSIKNTIKYISAGHQSSNFPIPSIEQNSVLF
jgi:hypothetical protein